MESHIQLPDQTGLTDQGREPVLRNKLQKIMTSVDRFVGYVPIHNDRFRQIVLIIAMLALFAGIYFSFRSQPGIFREARLGPIVILALFAVPATIYFNALEFVLSARLIGHKIGLKSAAETSVIGGVANMLPLPGGVLVRVAALKAEGASVAKSTSVMAFVAFIWAAVSFGYAGTWLVIGGATAFGLSFIALGFMGVVGCFALSMRLLDDHIITAQLFACKAGLVLVDALRLYLCLLALNVAAEFGQASVLTVSGFVGSSFSIVPAGLGIREGVSALLGPLVGLTAAAAFLASAANRIIGLMVSAPIAALLAWKSGQKAKIGAA
jgi:uncharacterized membrane protein YbhN (UPF0104 family)